ESDLEVADLQQRRVGLSFEQADGFGDWLAHRRALAFGSSASRTTSPSMRNERTVIDSAAAGYSRTCGLVRMEVRACPMSLPQDMIVGGRPIPRNDRVASATMNVPSETVAMTITGAIAFGITCRSRILNLVTPR